MSEHDNQDFEIGDVENYRGNRDEGFSHSQLVMSAMRKCLEAGCKEMRCGWMNEKMDKHGNINRMYVEDTRKLFVESVETCIMFMCCDYDSDAEEKINALFKEIEDQRKEYADLNETAWNNLKPYEQDNYIKRGDIHIKGKITHARLIEEMIIFELKIYRKIFAELTKLTERKQFYKEEEINA